MIKPKRTHQKKNLSLSKYIQGLQNGNISVLSQAITMVESTKIEHQKLAQQILEKIISNSGNSVRIGITGVPGVGKSTFIEIFGKYLTRLNKKVAVLAIDPSSDNGSGSILGDKTRMEQLSRDTKAFIRPSPTKGSLGGVARKTRETILLCEAAGYDVIFIETVGVGQSETAVHSMVDFFLLLMLAGAGDELQGIKRGIMEMADAIAITKADGDNLNRSKVAVGDYKRALHLFPGKRNGWIPKTSLCSALNNEGVQEIWNTISSFINHCKTNNTFEENRTRQAKFWLHESIQEQLGNYFYHNNRIKKHLAILEKEVENGKTNPFDAANQLIHIFQKK
jgi:LAO/AO transport system kinase